MNILDLLFGRDSFIFKQISGLNPKVSVDDLEFLKIKHPELEAENLQISNEIVNSRDIEKRKNAFRLSQQDMHLIIEGIYLGNLNAYKNWVKNATDYPGENSIIISATQINGDTQPPENVQHLILNIEDDKSAWLAKDGIRDQLKEIFSLIDQARLEKKRLLIHCMAGKSRSAAILTAYLMWSCRQRYEEVLSFIRNRRALVVLSDELADVLAKDFQEMLDRAAESR